MKWMPKESIKISMLEHFEEFKTNYPDIANVADKLEGHKSYFEDKIDGNFNWKWHGEILEKLQLHHAPKDISILDIGTQFGFVPHFLKEYGFTDVTCTNSSKEAHTGLDDLQKVWKVMNLEPMELHIEAEKEITLDKKYDLILMNSTNALWNNKRLCHYTEGILNSHNYVVDHKEQPHTFIVPFSISELKDFIREIQSCLTKDGIAIIQPFPFPYRVPAFKEELELVEGHFHKILHWDVTEENASRDYFVISGT